MILPPVSSANPVLEVINISKRYANHQALQSVSFAIPEGSIFGLLGPNGAGKSSLIRIINRMSYPDAGTIKINQKELDASHVLSIGYLPEERGLYKKMKVGEHLVYFARLRGLSPFDAVSKAKQRLVEMEAGDWWDKKIESLSKGMQQKVQFAAATLHAPKLLILDEPFSGFDPLNAELLQNELLALKQNGTSIMLSTHRMDTVEALCDHIALLHQSQLVLSGPTKQIKNQFKSHLYRVVVIGELPASSLFDVVSANREGEETHALIQLNEQAYTLNQAISAIMQTHTVKAFAEELPQMQTVFKQAIQQRTHNHDD